MLNTPDIHLLPEECHKISGLFSFSKTMLQSFKFKIPAIKSGFFTSVFCGVGPDPVSNDF